MTFSVHICYTASCHFGRSKYLNRVLEESDEVTVAKTTLDEFQKQSEAVGMQLEEQEVHMSSLYGFLVSFFSHCFFVLTFQKRSLNTLPLTFPSPSLPHSLPPREEWQRWKIFSLRSSLRLVKSRTHTRYDNTVEPQVTKGHLSIKGTWFCPILIHRDTSL